MTISDSRGLQLRSTVLPGGTLDLRLELVDMPDPAPDEVVVRIDASPINPSDVGLLLAGADLSTAKVSMTANGPTVTANLPLESQLANAGRTGQSLPVGAEGAGVVVKAGTSDDAQGLLGKTVAVLGGGMYSQYKTVRAKQCLPLPPGISAADGAACFVNPLTALGMVETMRSEGHSALAHTAAASNVGRMLLRVCQDEGVELVNIVRKPEQAQLLRSLGAKYVCNSSEPGFVDDLTDSLAETHATIAFDATGGGRLAGQLLAAMESALSRGAEGFSRYGSTTHKQVYIYGNLDRRPTELVRDFGMSWGLGGWLLAKFLQRIGPEATRKLQERVASEVQTTFATDYAKEISLTQVLEVHEMLAYSRLATGGKYLVNPNKGL